METIKLGKYTLKYYLGVYLSTDDEKFFRRKCMEKRYNKGWTVEVNSVSMSINNYLGE